MRKFLSVLFGTIGILILVSSIAILISDIVVADIDGSISIFVTQLVFVSALLCMSYHFWRK